MDITQEEKELLISDLCGRLPYGVKAKSQTSHLEINTIDSYFVDGDGRKMFHFSEPDFWQTVDNFQYYLRPMSSMTEEEKEECNKTKDKIAVQWDDYGTPIGYEYAYTVKTFDWLNTHHFDYRGLIEKGLALEAPNDMYKLE